MMREYALHGVRVTDVSLICDNRLGAYSQTILKQDKGILRRSHLICVKAVTLWIRSHEWSLRIERERRHSVGEGETGSSSSRGRLRSLPKIWLERQWTDRLGCWNKVGRGHSLSLARAISLSVFGLSIPIDIAP